MSGLRIASTRGVPGSAGALTRDADGTLFLLTVSHVVLGGGAVIGDRVWALPPEDDGGEAVLLGRARRGQLGRVAHGGRIVFVDAALVALEERHPAWVVASLTTLVHRGVSEATRGSRVHKRGAATGFTDGVLASTEYPDYPTIEGRAWEAPGQLLVDAADPARCFAAAGDSGAAVCDEAGGIVGLLWGSSGHGQGVACPIAPVLAHLNVTLAPGLSERDHAERRQG